MIAGDGRGYLWTTFNKPARITKGGTVIHLAYNADRSRMLKQVDGGTNWYLGGLYERSRKSDGSETHKFIISDGVQVTQYKSAANQWTAQSTRYLLKDHLGSVDVITDEQGNALNQLSFNAWGQRRTGTWNSFSGSELSALITQLQQDALSKGYTGHEMDDEVGLINMKGRIYDPALGRFLSADPHIQAPGDSQSYNRYSYVKNNPLSYTDPSGYFFKSFNRFMKKYGRVIVAVALAYITAGASLAALGAAAYTGAGVLSFTGAVVAGAAGGFASGLVMTGTLSGAMNGAVFGALSGGIAHGIGHGVGNIKPFTGYGKHIAHGVTQGGLSTLQGGKFKHGFVSAFASSAVEGKISGIGDGAKAPGVIAARTASAAVVGGTVSAITGGKFANGAVTGAFVHLFNAEANSWSPGFKKVDRIKWFKLSVDGLSFSLSMKEAVVGTGLMIFASESGVGFIGGALIAGHGTAGILSSGFEVIKNVMKIEGPGFFEYTGGSIGGYNGARTGLIIDSISNLSAAIKGGGLNSIDDFVNTYQGFSQFKESR